MKYSISVEHYCAVKGTIWIGKVHASSIGGCILGFRRLHLTDQTAPSLALGVGIRSQERPTVATKRFLLIFWLNSSGYEGSRLRLNGRNLIIHEVCSL